MSICMKEFSSEPAIAEMVRSRDLAKEERPFQLECASCGYEPEDFVSPPSRCPKCFGSGWERHTRPGSLLAQANRRFGRPNALVE
jgi:predicted Zn-ribbon and HTH transcriptional regulator